MGAMGKLGKQVQKVLQKVQPKSNHVKLGEGEVVPSDVAMGSLAVYVGVEKRRFVIKAELLKHDVLQVLLAKSAEEFGFSHGGGLVIACEPSFFEHLVWLVETKSPSLCHMDLRDYWAFTLDSNAHQVVD